MSPLVLVPALLGWALVGIAAAAWLARANEARGTRRVPALERRLGRVYLAGVLLGPVAVAAVAVLLVALRRIDDADARAADRARAERLAARREARAEERDDT